MIKKSIYVAVLNEGEIRTELASVLNHILLQSDYKVYLKYHSDKPIAFNRNKIVKQFLESGCDYLLQLDSDIVPPPNILQLADYQVDIISGLMFAFRQTSVIPLILKKNWDDEYNVMPFRGDEGLTECDATGTGSMMIARHVLADPRMKAPFLNEYNYDGIKVRGLDLAFCSRAKELGYKVYVNLDYPCSHIVRMDLKNIYSALLESSGEKVANREIKFKIRK